MNRVTLSVELDITTDPVTVKDVAIMRWNGHAPYRIRVASTDRDGIKTMTHPWAVLAECSAPSREEALAGLRGIVRDEPDLEWTHKYDTVRRFLNPGPFGW